MKTLHRGLIASDPKIISVKPLTRDDLAILRVEKRPVQGIVKSFRDSHHRIARLVASGLRNDQVCLRAGISITRLCTLRQDPAFQELVSTYRDKVTEAFVEQASDFYEVATANMLKAEVMLGDVIDKAIEADEPLPAKTLIAIAEGRADRFGYPKMKQTHNVNENYDFAAMLEATAKRSGRSNVIDATSTRIASAPRVPQSHAALPSGHTKPAPAVAGIRRRA